MQGTGKRHPRSQWVISPKIDYVNSVFGIGLWFRRVARRRSRCIPLAVVEELRVAGRRCLDEEAVVGLAVVILCGREEDELGIVDLKALERHG